MLYDVLVVGGGPGGLSAALALGRARKRVLVCDAGPRRNAAATHIHNFITRDGTPPNEFRSIAREQLAEYPNVEHRAVHVTAITGASGNFEVKLDDGSVRARRIVLATGMIDEMLPIDGFAALWGRSIFQCPYCHGWEVRDRPWGFLATAKDHAVPFASVLRAWTRDVVMFTNGAFELAPAERAGLEAIGVRIETASVTKLVATDDHLSALELAGGRTVAREILFAHPPQRHVEVVRALGLALDEQGCVKVDPMKRETSIPGIFAAGDLTTRAQAAILAAAAGMQAAAAINVELTIELATTAVI